MTRAEAIKFLELDKKDRGECFISDAIDMAIKALEQKPNTGHWIMGERIADGFTCSECGTRYEEYPIEYNYCPNCGVKMTESEDWGNEN